MRCIPENRKVFVYFFFIASGLFLAMFAFRNVNSGKCSTLIQSWGLCGIILGDQVTETEPKD